MMRAIPTAIVLLAAVLLAHDSHAQDAARRGLVWNGRPSIVFGDDVHVDVRAKMVFDWRAFDPELDEKEYDLTVLRVGLKGELSRHVDFEIERELNEDGRWEDWKDVYLNWDTFDAFSVRAGRFKMPFGFEQNLGRMDLDFAYRARISTGLAPARDKGVLIYGPGPRPRPDL